MSDCILIDLATLRLVVKTPTERQAELWADWKLGFDNYIIIGPEAKYFAKFSEMELRKMFITYYGQEPQGWSYAQLVQGMANVSSEMPCDNTDTVTLSGYIARDCYHLSRPVPTQHAAPTAPVAVAAMSQRPATNTPTEYARPKAGTATGRVWEIADQLTAAKGSKASRQEVVDACVKEGINSSTASTQYGKWNKA